MLAPMQNCSRLARGNLYGSTTPRSSRIQPRTTEQSGRVLLGKAFGTRTLKKGRKFCLCENVIRFFAVDKS